MAHNFRVFVWSSFLSLILYTCVQAVEVDKSIPAPLKLAYDSNDTKAFSKEVNAKLSLISGQILSAQDIEYLYQALALMCAGKFAEVPATQKIRQDLVSPVEDPRSGVNWPTRMKFMSLLTKIPTQSYQVLDEAARKKALLDIAKIVAPSWSTFAREAARVRSEPEPKVAWGVQPPKGSEVPPGSDPAAISDPALRKEYEQALAVNAENAKALDARVTMLQAEKRYQETFSRWFRSLHESHTLTEGEIRTLLKASDCPKEFIDLVFDPAH
jgi:hypothetical protein